jgi:hypothetical protein
MLGLANFPAIPDFIGAGCESAMVSELHNSRCRKTANVKRQSLILLPLCYFPPHNRCCLWQQRSLRSRQYKFLLTSPPAAGGSIKESGPEVRPLAPPVAASRKGKVYKRIRFWGLAFGPLPNPSSGGGRGSLLRSVFLYQLYQPFNY